MDGTWVRAVGLPTALLRRDVKVLRPRDAADVYAYPPVEFRRLEARGVLRRLATGYYAVVPSERVGDARWRPSMEAMAWGIAAADYGRDRVALAGVSAARVHGALPRAVAVARVTVPTRRPPVEVLGGGEVRFAVRNVADLEVEATTTDLGRGWVTTVEQTVLDLANLRIRDLEDYERAETLRTLLGMADEAELRRVALEQHRAGALASLPAVR